MSEYAPLSASIDRERNAAVVRFDVDELDRENAEALSRAYLPLAATYCGLRVGVVVVDLRAVQRLDLTGARFLLWLWSVTGQHLGASTRLCIDNAQVRRVAQSCLAGHAFAIFDTIEDALGDARMA